MVARMDMPPVRLIRIDPPLLEALAAATFPDVYGADAGTELQTAKRMVMQTLEHEHRAHAPWVGYLVVDTLASVLVGGCGFKANPAADGSVEIAYRTFEPFRERGFATEMALELVAIARASGKATWVVAHTLPERNASTSVLTKAGFRCVGEVTDSEDGKVRQWCRELAPERGGGPTRG